MNRSAALAVILLLVGGAAGTAATHLTTDPIVAERQASMKAMASAAKTIAGMFDGRLAYDALGFKDAAETIRQRSGDALVAEFPADTLGVPSAAKREIQKSHEEFAALARHIEGLATALSAAADKAANGITDAMRMEPGMAMGGSLLGKRANAATDSDPSRMPAEHIFHLILQDCTSCHAEFREKVSRQ